MEIKLFIGGIRKMRAKLVMLGLVSLLLMLGRDAYAVRITGTGSANSSPASSSWVELETSGGVSEHATIANILLLTVGANEVYGSGWNGDTSVPEKDDLYDYFILFDTDYDGDIDTIDPTLWALKLSVADIDNIPVEDETTAPVSSGWAYTHENGADKHPEYVKENRPYTAFAFLTDKQPVVASGKYETADTQIIIDFVDSDGDHSEFNDGDEIEVLCSHAGGYDFTSTNLFSSYGTDHDMEIGEIDGFRYDATNSRWVWVNTKAPTVVPSGDYGMLAWTAPGQAAGREIVGTANELEWTNGNGIAGNPTGNIHANVRAKYNRYHQTAHFDPDNQYATYGGIIVLDPYTAAAITISGIRVYLNENPTTELTVTVYQKAAAIGYTGGTVVGSGDTDAGVLSITTGWTDHTIPAGSKVWLLIGDNPDATTLDMEVALDGTYDD